jgi:hypothetical protein
MLDNTIPVPATGLSSCKCRDLTTPPCGFTRGELITLLKEATVDGNTLRDKDVYNNYFESLICTNGKVMDHCKKCAKTIDMHVVPPQTRVQEGSVITPPKGWMPWYDVNPYEGQQSSTHTLAPFSMISVLIEHYGPQYPGHVGHCWVLKTLFPSCYVGHSVGAHIIPRRARKESYLRALQNGFLSSWTEEMIDNHRNGIVLAKFLEIPFDNLEWCFVPSKEPKRWDIVIFSESSKEVPIIDYDGESITVGEFKRNDKKGAPLTFGDLTRTSYDLCDVSVSALAVHALFTFKKHGKIDAFPGSDFQLRAKDDSPIKKWQQLLSTEAIVESEPTCNQCMKPCAHLFRDVINGTMMCAVCWGLLGECKLCDVRFESSANAAELHMCGKAHNKRARERERVTK